MSQTRKLFLFLGLPLVVIAVIALVYSMNQPKEETSSTNESVVTEEKNTDTKSVSWSFDGAAWKASGTAPECTAPLTLKTPVDLTMATAILYPGQTRGQYKPHGGFRFDGLSNNNVTVTAPYDAIVTQGARYIESGEVQYLFDFVNECGIAYRFDHLLILSPKFQSLADTLPEAKVDDSRTTKFEPTSVAAGEIIATAIGFTKNKNVGVDFGVYDLRTMNAAAQSSSYRSAHQDISSLAFYATCWLDLLPEGDKATAKALPGGDGQAGKTSDYCK
jgi:hypothetical protein